jgi:hypothetical protein
MRRRLLLPLLLVPILCAGLCRDSNDDVLDQRLVGACCEATVGEPGRFDWVDAGPAATCVLASDLQGSGDSKSPCRELGYLGCLCDEPPPDIPGSGDRWDGFCDFDDPALDVSCVCTSLEGCDD